MKPRKYSKPNQTLVYGGWGNGVCVELSNLLLVPSTFLASETFRVSGTCKNGKHAKRQKIKYQKNAEKEVTKRQITICQNKRRKILLTFFTHFSQNFETMLDDVSGVLTTCNDQQ